MALLLDGKALSDELQRELIAPACAAEAARLARPVGLAVVVVGARKDSATYVRMKQRACAAVGMASWKLQVDLPVQDERALSQTQREAVVARVLETIRELNARADVDGIIVQLPLPSFCDEHAILATVDPAKDVDGLHPASHAALFRHATSKANGLTEEKQLGFSVPCTPAGCIELLDHYKIPLEGKRVVVLGRSQIVGLPVSLLCLHRNATVTMSHSRTKDLPDRVREADIVIAAIGRANFVKGDWIKPGAVVIDVGINAVDDATKKAGYRLVGDVDFDGAVKIAGAITPVPGGVGPMTVVMLLRNTLYAAQRTAKPKDNGAEALGP